MTPEQFCFWMAGVLESQPDIVPHHLKERIQSKLEEIFIDIAKQEPVVGLPMNDVESSYTDPELWLRANLHPPEGDDLDRFNKSFENLEPEDLPEEVEVQSFEVNHYDHDDPDLPDDLKALVKNLNP